ncbi:hypothetical protein HBI57_101060 [Parastagonospora nodorum]|nr:hypothetical protein HBI57_101060 [Parastagonospora nodorum]KAH6491443.1 hypothetical protein HBI58_053390 [Parastagonospora nodorum]
MKFLLLDSSTLACFRTSSLYILSSSGKSWSMNFGILTAADEEVLTKRLTDVVFADALRALIPAFRPISRARSRSSMPPTGEATWMNPSTPVTFTTNQSIDSCYEDSCAGFDDY